ncbi:hypothetical protein CR513_34086, partial [Mucuna pruriens]
MDEPLAIAIRIPKADMFSYFPLTCISIPLIYCFLVRDRDSPFLLGAIRPVPRSSTDPLYAFDPEIELTLRRLRKTRNLIVNNSRSSDPVINSNQFCTDNFVASSNIFVEPRQMENNDRTLKELATPDVVRRPPQASKGIPCGLLHNEAVGDIGGLHQNEGVPILPGWSSEGLAIPSASTFQHLGRYEAHIPGEVLSGIQNCVHQEGDMWDKAA